MDMQINTDRIKNKKFPKAINSSDIKHSQEYRVLATLRYLFPEKFKKMIKGDAPDLQDIESGIGIEVTAAVKEEDMRVASALADLQQGEEKDIGIFKKKIESFGYSVVMNEAGRSSVSTTGTGDGEKFYFKESIRRKIKKIPKYRKKFMKIGLAVFLPETPTDYAEDNFSEWISEVLKESNCWFDFFYVISERFCIYYDYQEGGQEKQTFTKEEKRLLSTIARMTAEGELSLTDLEWM